VGKLLSGASVYPSTATAWVHCNIIYSDWLAHAALVLPRLPLRSALLEYNIVDMVY